jgi:hypothetical protein
MDIKDIVTFLAGSLFGWVLQLIWDYLLKRFRSWRISRRREWWTKHFNLKKIYKWLNEYYLQQDQEDVLFVANLGESTVRIPILTKPSWHIRPRSTNEVVNLPVSYKKSTARIDKKFIN